MSDKIRSRSQQAAKSPDQAYLDTLASDMPEMSRLFAILDAGATPNFLDIIAAISEMVAFYTDHDQIEADKVCELLKRSGKKCRICS